MEVTTCCSLLALVLTVASVDGFIEGLTDKFSEKELLGMEDMYHNSKMNSNRFLRSVGDNRGRNVHGNLRRRWFPDYKRCCSENGSKNETGQKERWQKFKNCAEKDKAYSKELERSANPIEDEYSCERLKQLKIRHYCFAECLLNEFGAVHDDGALNKEKATEFIMNSYSTEWLKGITANAVGKCAVEKDNGANKEELKCNPRAMNFKHCVWKEIVMNCPEEHYKRSEYCSRVKKAFEEMKQ